MKNKKTRIISMAALLLILNGCSNTASKEENNNTSQDVMIDETEDSDVSADVQIAFSSSVVSLTGITADSASALIRQLSISVYRAHMK